MSRKPLKCSKHPQQPRHCACLQPVSHMTSASQSDRKAAELASLSWRSTTAVSSQPFVYVLSLTRAPTNVMVDMLGRRQEATEWGGAQVRPTVKHEAPHQSLYLKPWGCTGTGESHCSHTEASLLFKRLPSVYQFQHKELLLDQREQIQTGTVRRHSVPQEPAQDLLSVNELLEIPSLGVRSSSIYSLPEYLGSLFTFSA